MIKQAFKSSILALLLIMVYSCEKDEISDKEGKTWLETIQNDTGTSLVKAIWEENEIDTPLFSFEYNEQHHLIKMTNQDGTWLEYDYLPDGRISEKRAFHTEGTSYKYLYEYDDLQKSIKIQAIQVIEWGDEYPEEVYYYHPDKYRDRLICEVKMDHLTGYDSVGNEIFEHRLIFKAEFRMDGNTMLEMLEFSPQASGEWVYAGSSTYEYDDKTNPLFQPNFPPLDRGMYQFGAGNITAVIGGMERLYYSYEYNSRGLPFKRSMEGGPSWYFQYY